MNHLLRTLAYLWASPNTMLGLAVGLLGLATRGQGQVRRGAMEFTGGAVTWCFENVPAFRFAGAMTLGHVILGRTAVALEYSRDHEHVHVRQYERWGPFFLPMYGLFSLEAWWRGEDYYRDNRFEREAFTKVPRGKKPSRDN